MMSQAFYTGISGMQTYQAGIDTISDNLANISTVGYRGYNTEFSSLFENSMNTGSGLSNSIGVGVQTQTTTMVRDRGSMMHTDKTTDLAIMGDGWFGITDQSNTQYTRAGDFTFDKDSDLVTTDGYYVLGTMGNNISGNTLTATLSEIPLGDVTAQERLRFPQTLTYPSEPSSVATFMGNIGVENETRTMGAAVIDPLNVKNNLQLSFTQVVPQVLPGSQWDITATTQTLDGETIYDTQAGVVNFDARGALLSNTLGNIDNNGASVAIELGEEFGGVVSINNLPITGSSITDGIMSGELDGYQVDRNGEVIAVFSNGRQSSVGQIAVYHFTNEQGLLRESGTRFSESSNSGKALFYQDENGQNVIGTTVANNNLETSNVRMEIGLTNLIIYQRAYDANSKSITTADEMMQKALQMDA